MMFFFPQHKVTEEEGSGTIGRYSVVVTGLPPDVADGEEVRRHLSAALGEAHGGGSGAGEGGGACVQAFVARAWGDYLDLKAARARLLCALSRLLALLSFRLLSPSIAPHSNFVKSPTPHPRCTVLTSI